MTLARLLRPQTIAVIGGGPAREVVRQNDRLGFAGQVFPIHPFAAEVAGHRVFRTLDELPCAPDAVFLAVNRHLTVEYVRDLAAMGAGGVVSYASGFAEVGGEGVTLQSALREAAGSMPVLGPNCYGAINFLDGAALWPDQHGGVRVSRGVALVTQSGNIGLNLTMQRRALPIGLLVTLGNQAVVGASALVAALARDHRISAIGLHLETIDDADAFAVAVAEARAKKVFVVTVVAGASPEGAALALSHTAQHGSCGRRDGCVSAKNRRGPRANLAGADRDAEAAARSWQASGTRCRFDELFRRRGSSVRRPRNRPSCPVPTIYNRGGERGRSHGATLGHGLQSV